MMGDLQREEKPIDEAIVSELVELTPDWWNAVALEVVYSSENGIEKYTHVISSLEGHGEPVLPSDDLYAATHELGLLFRRHGRQWRRVRYEIRRRRDGSWNYAVTFEY